MYLYILFTNVIHRVLQLMLAACRPGSYGLACRGVCQCGHNTLCHHVTGQCHCKPGFMGSNCSKGLFLVFHVIWMVGNWLVDWFVCWLVGWLFGCFILLRFNTIMVIIDYQSEM